MNRWLALIPLAVLAALAALFIGWSLKRDPAFKPDALVGQGRARDRPAPAVRRSGGTGQSRPEDRRRGPAHAG